MFNGETPLCCAHFVCFFVIVSVVDDAVKHVGIVYTLCIIDVVCCKFVTAVTAAQDEFTPWGTIKYTLSLSYLYLNGEIRLSVFLYVFSCIFILVSLCVFPLVT